MWPKKVLLTLLHIMYYLLFFSLLVLYVLKLIYCHFTYTHTDLAVHMVECESLRVIKPFSSHFESSFPTPPGPSSPFAATFPRADSTNTTTDDNLMMCPTCHEPFMHLDDLQVHM